MTDFWAGRRVLVTGHTGFKGGWLSLWLGELGARVTGFAAPPPTDPALFALARIADLVDDVRGDVRDLRRRRGVRRGRPARRSCSTSPRSRVVRRAWREPADAFMINTLGTVHVLEAVRRRAPEAAVVAITTDKVYADPDSGRRFGEDDPLGGEDPYSASKAAAELAAASYRDSYGLRIATARAGNVIGGGDWAEARILPDAVRAARAGRPAGRARPGLDPPVAARPESAERLSHPRPAPGRVRRVRARHGTSPRRWSASSARSSGWSTASPRRSAVAST